MSKVLKTVTTILLAVAMGFITYYLLNQNVSHIDSLNYPSYYVGKTLISIFVSGAVGVIISVVSNFLSWSKKMDEKEDVLSNAGFVSKDERESFVTGSTLDTMTFNNVTEPITQPLTQPLDADGYDNTVVLNQTEDVTVVLNEDNDNTVVLDNDTDKTVVLNTDDDRTVVLSNTNDKTEILNDSMTGGNKDA